MRSRSRSSRALTCNRIRGPETPMADRILPVVHQPALPRERLILAEAPDAEALEMDVVIVGAGPAGLSCAIELARLAKQDGEAGGELGELQIAILDKAATLGEHSLSGAVVNPRAFRELFPEMKDGDFPFRGEVRKEQVLLLRENGQIRLPTPPPMRNHGNYIASICEIVRWLGTKAEERGINALPGFAVDSLFGDGQKGPGCRTTPSGRKRDGTPGAGAEPPADLTA